MVFTTGKVITMKRFMLFIMFLMAGALSVLQPSGKDLNSGSVLNDSIQIITKYSLFSEYHKNKDYESAYPYGWEVLKVEPNKFAKWIYYKMEDITWFFHDSTDYPEAKKKAVADTTRYLYDMAMKYYPERQAYFQLKKAYITEFWLKVAPELAAKEYEKAIALDSGVAIYYYNRLGQLYKTLAQDNPEYKTTAIDFFTFLSDKEPNNPQWNQELEGLVESIDELVALAKKAWDLEPENLAKAWKYTSLCLKSGKQTEAIEALEKMVVAAPTTINYWNQLSSLYFKTDQLDKAIDAYKKLVELEPNTKEHYLNLGIALKDKGQLSAARTQFIKASEVGNNWGLPIFYEGLLYETAARNCGFEFMDKCVYQLAVDTYRRAYAMDASTFQAKERMAALGSSVPQKEDYFFRKYKSGQRIEISGNCYGWIGKSIVVP